MGSTRFHLAVSIGLVVSTACASSGGTIAPTGDAGTDAGAVTDGGTGSGPGRIYLSTSTISNQSGKILLAGVGNTSRLCWQIPSNSAAMPATAMTNFPGGNNPCDPTVTPETIFDAGATTVTVGIYVGGQQTPEKSVTRNVVVAGDTTDNIDGTLLSQ
jgi:hypothetical protein